MTFEEQFPSLKGLDADFSENGFVGVLFGSLYEEGPVVHTLDVEVNCLDKQRVRELLHSEKAKKATEDEAENNGFNSALRWIEEELGL